MKQSDLIEKLTAFFANETKAPFIKLAYLFGSRADSKEGPISDYDIAVLYSKPHPPKMRHELAHKLAIVLMTDQVDLMVLNSAPIELRYAERPLFRRRRSKIGKSKGFHILTKRAGYAMYQVDHKRQFSPPKTREDR